MSTCRDCDATIRFVILDTGRPLPVDPIPFPDRGNVAARADGNRLIGYVIARDKPLRDGHRRYMPHRASCRPAPAPVPRTPDLFDAAEPALDCSPQHPCEECEAGHA